MNVPKPVNIWLGHSLRHSALARPRAVTGAPLVLSSKQQQPVLEPLGRATNHSFSFLFTLRSGITRARQGIMAKSFSARSGIDAIPCLA
jgi:hypothetical protein